MIYAEMEKAEEPLPPRVIEMDRDVLLHARWICISAR
jgi:hypothetical protein